MCFRSRRIAIQFLLLNLFVAAAPFAAPSAEKTPEECLRDLEEGRTLLQEDLLTAAKNGFEALTQRDAKNATYEYQLGRVYLYLARVSESRRDNKLAGRRIESGIAAVEKSLQLDERSSDAHSLLADLYGKKINFGGMFAGMKYGPKIIAENKRALELDPNNPRAHASLGRQYLFAPKMFGGDTDKAIESFQKATTLDPQFDEAYVWLALAYQKKGNAAEAKKALQQALRLNHRSSFARHTAEGLEK